MERCVEKAWRTGWHQGTSELWRPAEAACFDTLNDGIATKDLVNLMEGVEAKAVNSAGFIAAIRERLEKRLA